MKEVFFAVVLIFSFSCSQGREIINASDDGTSFSDADSVDQGVNQGITPDEFSDNLTDEIQDSSDDDITDQDQHENPCAGIDCGGHGTCQEEKTSVTCLCEAGYDYSKDNPLDCIDIDECHKTPDICGSSLCENTEGSYTCIKCSQLLVCDVVAGTVSGEIKDIVLYNDLIYVFSSGRYDVLYLSESGEQEYYGGREVDGTPLFVAQDMLFVFNEANGKLRYYNVTNYFDLELKGEIKIFINDIFYKDDILHLIGLEDEADPNQKYFIYDIRQDENPSLLSEYEFIDSNPDRVLIKGNYAYLSSDKKLSVLNISDPSDPIEVSTDYLEKSGSWDMDINGNYLYLAAQYQDGMGNGEKYLKSYDISNPEAIVEKDSVELTDWVEKIRVSEKFAVVEISGEIIIYQLLNGSEFSFFEKIDDGYVNGAAFYYDMMVLAFPGSLKLYEIMDEIVFKNEMLHSISGVKAAEMDEGKLYMSENSKTLSIYDFTNPQMPEYVNGIDAGNCIVDAFDYYAGKVFIGCRDRIEYYDVSDPENLELKGSLAIDYEISDIEATDDYLFISYYESKYNFGLKIFNYSDPADIDQISYINLYEDGMPSQRNVDIVVDRNYVYFAGTRFYIIDFDNIASPIMRDNYVDSSSRILVDGNRMYGSNIDKLELFNIGNKDSVSSFQQVDLELGKQNLQGIWKKDDLVYGAGYGGIHLFDVSVATKSRYSGFFEVDGNEFSEIILDEENIYLIGDGVRIIKQENLGICASKGE
jgi:hypothetical protein